MVTFQNGHQKEHWFSKLYGCVSYLHFLVLQHHRLSLQHHRQTEIRSDSFRTSCGDCDISGSSEDRWSMSSLLGNSSPSNQIGTGIPPSSFLPYWSTSCGLHTCTVQAINQLVYHMIHTRISLSGGSLGQWHEFTFLPFKRRALHIKYLQMSTLVLICWI